MAEVTNMDSTTKAAVSIGPISGLADYDEAEHVMFGRWLSAVRGVYRLHGFVDFHPRPLERRDVLHAKGGVGHQIFGVTRLATGGDTDLALPFDRTVSLGRWMAAHSGEVVLPFKRADVSFSFRGERPQAGRFIGFYQADVDIIGPALGPDADAECLSTVSDALERLDIGQFTFFVSHLGLMRAWLEREGVVSENRDATLRAVDKLIEVGVEETTDTLVAVTGRTHADVARMLATLSAETSLEELRVQMDVAGALRAPFEQLAEVVHIAEDLGVPGRRIRIAPKIARGLDYYTGTVFETLLEGAESFGSISSGGRYDDLVNALGGRRLEAVGGSIGLTRLFDIAVRTRRFTPTRRTHAPVIVGAREPALMSKARRIAAALRAREIPTDLAASSGARQVLQYSRRKGFVLVVLVMDESSFVVRRLGDGEQVDVPTPEAAIDNVTTQVCTGGFR